MSRFDHAGDAAADFAMVSMMAADPERKDRYVRRRNAAALWSPALLIAALVGGYAHTWLAFIGVLAVLSTLLVAYSERPAFLFRR